MTTRLSHGDEQEYMRTLLTPARRRVLTLMADRRLVRVRDIQRGLGHRSESSACDHLRRLRAAGLVELTPAGYRLATVVAVAKGGSVGILKPVDKTRGNA